jgi:hypothetical protein
MQVRRLRDGQFDHQARERQQCQRSIKARRLYGTRF